MASEPKKFKADFNLKEEEIDSSSDEEEETEPSNEVVDKSGQENFDPQEHEIFSAWIRSIEDEINSLEQPEQQNS